MGRVTEFIDYLNRAGAPTEAEQAVRYNYLQVTKKLAGLRAEYRRERLRERRASSTSGQSSLF